MTDTMKNHIVCDPEICGGKPCVAGTRIRVQDIHVWHHWQGRSVDEIVSTFKQLTMGDVHAALAWYWDHRPEIDQQMAEEQSLVARMKLKYGSPLQEKLAQQHGSHHPVSS